MENIIPSRVSTAGKLLKNAIVAIIINLILSFGVFLIAVYRPGEKSQDLVTLTGVIILLVTIYSLYELYHAGDYLQKSYWESEDETIS
jgi:hypothetical protein